jgi:hypothetical protein
MHVKVLEYGWAEIILQFSVDVLKTFLFVLTLEWQ